MSVNCLFFSYRCFKAWHVLASTRVSNRKKVVLFGERRLLTMVKKSASVWCVVCDVLSVECFVMQDLLIVLLLNVWCLICDAWSVKCDVWYVALCVNTIGRCLIWHLSSNLRKPRPSTALRQEISSVVGITIIQPVLHAICNHQFSLAGIQGVAGPIPGHQSCWRVYRGQCNNAFLGFNDLNK